MVAEGGGAMNFFDQLSAWLGDANRWSWTDSAGVPYRTLEHLRFSLLALAVAAVLTIPFALWLAHYRRGAFLATSAVNIGRAIPSFGLIILVWFLASRLNLDLDFWPLLVALVALALPPLFSNTYAGVVSLDQATIDAARGTGYREWQIMLRLELPLASPVILAAARVSFLQLIATVAIGAIVNDGGGLGRYIIDGFALGQQGQGELFLGGLAAVILALLCDGAFALIIRLATPRGLALVKSR
jgi:osmoprotectant transport system permease protein